MMPPLTVDKEHLDLGIALLDEAITEYELEIRNLEIDMNILDTAVLILYFGVLIVVGIIGVNKAEV